MWEVFFFEFSLQNTVSALVLSNAWWLWGVGRNWETYVLWPQILKVMINEMNLSLGPVLV